MSIYANKGATFEQLIEYANRRYKASGIAVIEKQHTLCKPLRNGTGRIVSAKFEIKATVDYMGRYGKIPIAFEAKHTNTDRIALDRVEPHQCEFLQNWTDGGKGIGFILLGFRWENYFLIPWESWDIAKKAREQKTTKATINMPPCPPYWFPTGKASIKLSETPDEWRVQTGGNAALDYLATVKKIWSI